MAERFESRTTSLPLPTAHKRISIFNFAVIALLFVRVIFSATAADPFLGPACTVILVSGLPGDLESESAYNDQLHTWLQILESVHPKQLIVLADNPSSITLPASLSGNGSVFASSRSNFLATAAPSKASKNPLVVVIWGHGGKQGNTPAFHVRGPRITPSDLSAFAERVDSIESYWLLCFRGSGFFASKLAGSHRQILSSENDTIFNSDPIEMSSMLKVIRENPTFDFATFAESVGRATAEWYKERSLARTEEPTLWLPNQKPKNLAAAFEEKALGGVDASSSGSLSKATNTASNAVVQSNALVDEPSPDSPAVWKGLKRVEPQDYPDSDAVVLRRHISYTLAANPAVAAEHDEFIEILTPEGKRYCDFDISFSPPSEDINFSACEVLSPDGKLTRLNPDSIREANDESLGDYNAGRRKFFSLPGVVPGAILHVNYRNEWKKFPLPHISLQIPVTSELPVRESTLHVVVPKDEPFHFALENIQESGALRGSAVQPDPVIKQGEYGTVYAWSFTNLSAASHEILAPPGQGIALLISTFPDWSDFAEWYVRISKLTDQVTPEIKTKAVDLTREAKTDRERVLSVYNYVTSLRYVAIPLGVNSFRPHAAANVFKNQFGDCKDKANLFNTMLRSLDINANLVLVPRFKQAYDALPGLSFNHAISRVTLPDQTIWVDTTDDVCRFGMLPPGDSGRRVLVIAGGTNSLTQLPVPEPGRHKLIVRGEVDCSRGSEALPAKFDVDATGYPDYELRESARDAKERADSIAILSARYRLSAGSFALEKQTMTSVAALDQDFKWSAQGSLVGLCSNLPQESTNHLPGLASTGRHALLRPPFWLPKEWDVALNRRRSGLFLNQGYPLVLDENIEITLSAQSRIAALPAAASEENKGPLKWNLGWARVGDNKVNVGLHAELSIGELSATEISIFQQELRALISAVNTSVSIESSFQK